MVPFGLSGGTGSAWRLRAGRCGLSDYGDLCQVIVHTISRHIRFHGPFMTRGKIFGSGALAFTVLALICLPRHLPGSPASVAPSFRAVLDSTHLTLSGSIGSEAHRSAVIARVQELFKGTRIKISDQLTSSADVAAAEWEPALPSLLGLLATLKNNGSLEISERNIVVAGTAAGPEQKAQVLRELAAAAGTAYHIEDHITVTSHSETVPRSSRASIQSGLDEILRRESVGFQSNSATLTPRGRATLDKLIPILRRGPDLLVEVGGHTDPYGDPTYNLQLSLRRAESVRQYFLDHDVSNRLTAVGYGASRPLSNERTRAAQQKNRRIEVRVKEER
jgi:OOP family OmpA-OmpF porin